MMPVGATIRRYGRVHHGVDWHASWTGDRHDRARHPTRRRVTKEEHRHELRQVAMGLGRIMQKVVRMAAIAAPVGLLALPAGAGDFHYSTSAYADGLTAESSWEEIMKKP